MEDEIQKRNTDCVYFLASPLTCKKGSECEYRHSESARLNPRDCWFWLNGSCLNPSCIFRHPPLEGLTEPVPDLAHHSAVPTSKSNVPCYFYFNAYCIKGDQCPFLHDTLPAQKFPKVAPETTTAHPPENKASTGSDTGPASVEVPVNPPGDTSELIKQEHFKEVQQPAPGHALEEPSPSAESSVPECEEPAIKLSEENLLPPGEYMNGSPQLGQDQGSEELVKECVEGDEWWESSPGFDVLVDDGSEQLAYEDDADYLLARERESEMLHSRLLQYDYEVPAGYDPIGYPDASYLYEHGVYDSYDNVDNGYTPEYFHRVSEHSMERSNLELMSNRKRKQSGRRHEVVDGRDGVDLRDHLRKCRRMDGSSRKHRSSRTRGSSREQAMRHGMGPLLHGGLASEVGKNMTVSSQSETESALYDSHRRGWSGYPQSSRHVRSRLRERESRRRHRKPLPILSEISQGSASKRAESSQVTASAAFTGPKTLAQIKEEKRRAREDGNSTGSHIPQHPKGPGPEDFEGPKALNELLRDRRRSVALNDSTNDPAVSASKQQHPELSGSRVEKRLSNVHSGGDNELCHPGTLEKQDTGYDSDFLDDDEDDDDDSLRKKLAHILSS